MNPEEKGNKFVWGTMADEHLRGDLHRAIRDFDEGKNAFVRDVVARPFSEQYSRAGWFNEMRYQMVRHVTWPW